MRLFNKIAIVGVGLIGGSMALEIKKKRLAHSVIGISRHKKSIAIARRRRAIDFGGTSLTLIKEADLIILATPVAKIIESLPRVFELAKDRAIIIDVASTKAEVLKTANKFATGKKNFIGCHPLAGSEKRGISNASLNLFQDSLCILTPGRIVEKGALKKIRHFWQRLGAKTLVVSPQTHDRILAFTSHLAHILAFSLISTVPSEYLKFAASGLKDTTRIASSDAQIWEDIFITNNKELISSLDSFEDFIMQFKKALKRKDRKLLHKFLRNAKRKRDSLG